MFRLVKQSICTRKVQSFALALTIAVSVGAAVALFLLGSGVFRGIELSSERAGAQILCVPSEAEDQLQDTEILFTGAPVGAYMQASLAEDMKNVAGVQAVTVQFYGQTLSESCCTADAATRIIGFDPETDWVIRPYVSANVETLADDEVIVGKTVTGYSDGKGKVLGREVKVVAVLDETGTYLDNCILMNLNACREMTKETKGLSHLWEKYGEPATLCSAILVKCDTADTKIVAGKLKRYVQGDYVTLQQQSILLKTQKSFDLIFTVMAACAVALTIATILQLVARFSTLVWDRRSELALFRALGATKKNLRALIFGEAFSLTAIGCVLGSALGVGIYQFMVSNMQSTSAFPFSPLGLPLQAAGILAICAAFLLVTLLAILIPLSQSSKIDPATAMSQVDLS